VNVNEYGKSVTRLKDLNLGVQRFSFWLQLEKLNNSFFFAYFTINHGISLTMAFACLVDFTFILFKYIYL